MLCGEDATVNLPGNGDAVLRRLREEQQKAEILDRRIWEYQAAIERLKLRQEQTLEQSDDTAVSMSVDESPKTRQHNNTSATSDKAISLQQRLLRSKVIDETWRQHQECLLLSRMEMSPPAVRVANATASTSASDPNVTLVQEALRCRNRLVKKALETQREIDTIKQDLREAHVRGMQLQELNRDAWNRVQQLRQQQEMENGSSVMVDTNTNDTIEGDPRQTFLQRLAKENIILKRALADVIARLDWSNDERLQEILLRLE